MPSTSSTGNADFDAIIAQMEQSQLDSFKRQLQVQKLADKGEPVKKALNNLTGR